MPNHTIPILPDYSPDDEWLQLSIKIIASSGNTNNSSKFLALFRALPKDIQRDYKTLLTSNNATTYNILVQELTNRLQLPDHAKFQTLHSLESIGDRSPKQFLRDLKHKYQAAGGINNSMLRYAFAYGLPEEYRNVVFANDPNNLNDAADRVDDLWNTNKALNNNFNPFANSQLGINSSSNMHTQNKQTVSTDRLEIENLRLSSTIEDMSETIKKLNQRLESLELANKTFTNRTNDSYQIPQRRSNQTDSNYYKPINQTCPTIPNAQNPQGLCYYHACFGTKARKCQDSCKWTTFTVPPHSCNINTCPWSKFIEPIQKN